MQLILLSLACGSAITAANSGGLSITSDLRVMSVASKPELFWAIRFKARSKTVKVFQPLAFISLEMLLDGHRLGFAEGNGPEVQPFSSGHFIDVKAKSDVLILMQVSEWFDLSGLSRGVHEVTAVYDGESANGQAESFGWPERSVAGRRKWDWTVHVASDGSMKVTN